MNEVIISPVGPAIKIDGLSFLYSGSEKKALKDITLEVEEGEFAFLTGKSRAGKSTLCLSLTGLIPSYIKGEFKGRIFIKGEDIAGKSVSEITESVGIVFQDYESQIFSTRVDLEVAFGLENRGLMREEMKKRVMEMLELTGLVGLEFRNPATLSGGQKQRLAIASVLALNPEVILLDEPLTDLDPEGREGIINVLDKLRKNGKTIFIVEHDIEIIDRAQKCFVLCDGVLFNSGSPESVMSDREKLITASVSPHPLIEVFTALGFDERPLTVDIAEKILKGKGIKVKNKTVSDNEDESGDVIVSIENLTFRYDNGITALKGIDLEIRKGDFVAIVGKNGSGKTTLAKHINRLLEPSSGRVFLAGEDVKKLKRSSIGRRVGYVFQNPDHQIFSETVYDEVAFAPGNFNFSESEIKERVERALKIVGLEGHEQADPFMLTRGEREKVAVASVLAVTPEIIILDEPTTGLDFVEVKNTMEMLNELNRNGKTIIIITHNMNIVAEYAKKVIAMKDGSVIFYGSTREFFGREELLKETGIRVPIITELSRRFGFTALSVGEFLESVYV